MNPPLTFAIIAHDEDDPACENVLAIQHPTLTCAHLFVHRRWSHEQFLFSLNGFIRRYQEAHHD